MVRPDNQVIMIQQADSEVERMLMQPMKKNKLLHSKEISNNKIPSIMISIKRIQIMENNSVNKKNKLNEKDKKDTTDKGMKLRKSRKKESNEQKTTSSINFTKILMRVNNRVQP